MAAIKLFGATITLQPVKSPVKDERDRDQMTSRTTSSSSSSDQAVGDERTVKKPDKIIPCPRCKSMETKFCYFNNYNVNQPRHFCKGCQRYWTAGGALRNVPVGAGRRKTKPPPPQPQPCRVAGGHGFSEAHGGLYAADDDLGYGLVEDGDDWQVVEQGSLQHLVTIKRRRTGDQCY